MYSGLRGERSKKGAWKGHSAPKVADPIESRGHWGHGRTRQCWCGQGGDGRAGQMGQTTRENMDHNLATCGGYQLFWVKALTLPFSLGNGTQIFMKGPTGSQHSPSSGNRNQFKDGL